jgi:hypothetical protein
VKVDFCREVLQRIEPWQVEGDLLSCQHLKHDDDKSQTLLPVGLKTDLLMHLDIEAGIPARPSSTLLRLPTRCLANERVIDAHHHTYMQKGNEIKA